MAKINFSDNFINLVNMVNDAQRRQKLSGLTITNYPTQLFGNTYSSPHVEAVVGFGKGKIETVKVIMCAWQPARVGSGYEGEATHPDKARCGQFMNRLRGIPKPVSNPMIEAAFMMTYFLDGIIKGKNDSAGTAAAAAAYRELSLSPTFGKVTKISVLRKDDHARKIELDASAINHLIQAAYARFKPILDLPYSREANKGDIPDVVDVGY